MINEMLQRVELYVGHFFGSDGLNTEWHSYRYERQKSGNVHVVHGLARSEIQCV